MDNLWTLFRGVTKNWSGCVGINGVQTLRTQDTSAWPDISALESEYLHQRPAALHIMQRPTHEYQRVTSNLTQEACIKLHCLGGERQSLVFMMSGCSSPCSTAGSWVEIIRPSALKDVCSVSLLIVNCSDEDVHTPVHSNQAVSSSPTDKRTNLTFNVY